MANQAYSEASDLMVGAGRVYFQRFDDPNQLHFLGNVSELNITTDVTTVEKYSSMNKKRELMASVTTQTQASGSMVLNEYNMYNLALGLYGTEGVYHQTGANLVNTAYVVPSVPGIIELRDVNGNRYTNVTNVSVAPLAPTPATAEFNPGPNVTVNNTVFTDPLNGTITVNGVNYTGTTAGTYVFSIDQAPTTGGDLDGLIVTAASSVLNMGTPNVTVATGTTGMTTLILTIDGITFTFNVNAGTTDSFTATQPGNYITVNVSPSITQYELGRDYTLEEECLRAGLINIKKNSRIPSGGTVLITCDVPDESYVTVSGAAAGKIEGSLLFSGDPNQGNAVMIEAWKCSIRPDGDLTGLIGDDFGEFTLNFNIMSDYENHPDYPLYKVTKLAENTDKVNASSVYDPTE